METCCDLGAVTDNLCPLSDPESSSHSSPNRKSKKNSAYITNGDHDHDRRGYMYGNGSGTIEGGHQRADAVHGDREHGAFETTEGQLTPKAAARAAGGAAAGGTGTDTPSPSSRKTRKNTETISSTDSEDVCFPGEQQEGGDPTRKQPATATTATTTATTTRWCSRRRRCVLITILCLAAVAGLIAGIVLATTNGGRSGGSSSSAAGIEDDFGGPSPGDGDGDSGEVATGNGDTNADSDADADADAPTDTTGSKPPVVAFIPNPPRDTAGDECQSAGETPISSTRHAFPVDNSVVSRIAYGSCFQPEEQISSVLWEDVRNFDADLFIWLGDNAYSSDRGTDMSSKRRAYNEARTDPYYATYGPIADPRVPVTGTWDDNDFGAGSGQGNDYGCLKSSQDEFVHHMSIPETDPRHPAQGERQRFGVYASHMFARPGTGTSDGTTTENGIHVINLDVRSHRSPTLSTRGPVCEGPEGSTMLGEEQWTWLERELLNKKSIIKVVTSGTQVLPPTTRERDVEEHCSYDFPGGSFDEANTNIGEGPSHTGTKYEGWGQIPQERTRLLRLAQQSINAGMTKRIIFLSGEQHWGELLAKKVPALADADGGGDAQVLYEVTASGIDQNWVEDVENSNRVRVRSADTRGDGMYDQECNFPFVVFGVSFDDCVDAFGSGRPACSTGTTSGDVHISGRWGNCLPEEEELVPRDRQRYSLENKCADNYHFTCSAQANYGTMAVDWDAGTITLSLRTPHHRSRTASEIVIDI